MTTITSDEAVQTFDESAAPNFALLSGTPRSRRTAASAWRINSA